ncbi:MAG TPA: HAD family hydrolase [Nocardioidaceae bacterium]|nr:HAD family hydrolase [Nocardioidaceae bacterium]
MADIDAVIFDWGGTLTPWRTVDYEDEWRTIASVGDLPAGVDAAAATLALHNAASQVWARARDEHRSATIDEICTVASIELTAERIAAYRAFWEPSTWTDPEVRPLFERLRAEGVAVGVLSNTVWPGAWHDEILDRDGVLHLIDGRVYTSEIDWTKPHAEAFAAARHAVGADDPARCVYVGDRLFDDIWGARNAGMRAVWVPHSDIPADQIGHTEGEPDAVVQSLRDIPDVLSHISQNP